MTFLPTLAPHQVHVWSFHLRGLAPEFLEPLLTPAERERQARFLRPEDAEAFARCRAGLRYLLGRYLQVSPSAISLSTGRWGKPHLGDHHRLRFNLSHSGDFALLAFALDRELGIDLERVRPDRDLEGIARRFFAPVEVSSMQTLAVEERCAAFYRVWTRKEAFVKAHGEGLTLPLDGFTVSVGRDAALEGTAFCPEEVDRWQLHALAAPAGYEASLCVAGSGAQISPLSLTF